MKLEDEGLIGDSRAFVYLAVVNDLTPVCQQGTFVLRKNMTPDQVVNALLAPPDVKYVDIGLRTGLRLEQITAKLQSLHPELPMDASEFYDIVKSPPAELLADYPWLTKILADAPKGASLEGFLWPATYRVLPDTTPEELVRLMLDAFAQNVGPERMAVPAARGMSFYQIVTLASIVEREAQLPEEMPLIAGVYANRLDPKKWGLGLLQSDPTIFYIHDTLELAKVPVPEWVNYVFWDRIKGGLTNDRASTRARSVQHLHEQGPSAWTDRHADDQRDRRGARSGHQGRLPVLPGEGRRQQDDGVRQDAQGARGQRQEVHETARMTDAPGQAAWPSPADFAAAPTAAERLRWEEADRAARPERLARLRARFAEAGVDTYFGVRREHMRYLTGFTLGEGEEKVAGNSGQFLVSADDVAVLADSRYTIQARREAPDARIVEAYNDLPARWPELMSSVGARRVAVEAGFVSHAVWGRLAAAAPDVELVPVEGWVEADRAVKEPAEVERIAAACAVADRALATLLPEIRLGDDRGRSRAPSRVADPHRRRRGTRVRCRLPGRPGGRLAPWRTRRPPDHRRLGAALRLRRPGGGLPKRHDADPLRRRAVGSATWRSTRPSRERRPPRSPRSRRRSRWWVRVAGCRAAGRSTESPETSSWRRGTATISDTGPVTASDSPPTRCRRSGGSPPRPRCQARRSSRSSRGSISMARWASGSRTWSRSMRPRVASNG